MRVIETYAGDHASLSIVKLDNLYDSKIYAFIFYCHAMNALICELKVDKEDGKCMVTSIWKAQCDAANRLLAPKGLPPLVYPNDPPEELINSCKW